MSTINYVIVETDSQYNNKIVLDSGDEIIVNSTIESVTHINRIATVIDAPEFTILKKGDKVIVHHNIFRLRNGMTGGRIQSNFHLEDNKYFVPLTEIFMYSRNGNDWEAIDPYCFVKPIKVDNPKMIGNLFVTSETGNTHKGNKKHFGIMIYPNKQLIELGINVGDEIIFSKNSEYEFVINGETYYKMSTKDIIAKI